ncbi:hypothetical protein [Paraburkholderia terricola]|uniref:Uncharacterized protein n=1 Tax=Paraburkholderia terricola TaxID=169427 RepID=A0ABU1LJE1_9BURK|nr:hypothetical protein [Paraburkholderia terricola]MDR6406841.1 hypothetical protein [Paraburkholderia terricola]MDR6479480.1 hypothetical protein [Paraburkholderia terricola]
MVFLFFWLIKKARRRTAGQRQRCVCRGSKTRIQYRRSGAVDAGWLEQNIVAVRGLAFIWLAGWGGFFCLRGAFSRGVAGLAFPWFVSGLLALPLCGAAPTFFAAAKKVGKESGSHR